MVRETNTKHDEQSHLWLDKGPRSGEGGMGGLGGFGDGGTAGGGWLLAALTLCFATRPDEIIDVPQLHVCNCPTGLDTLLAVRLRDICSTAPPSSPSLLLLFSHLDHCFSPPAAGSHRSDTARAVLVQYFQRFGCQQHARDKVQTSVDFRQHTNRLVTSCLVASSQAATDSLSVLHDAKGA